MTHVDAFRPDVDPALQARPLQGPTSAGQLSLEYLSGASSGNVNDLDAAGSEQESAVMRSKYRGLSWDKKHRSWCVRIYFAGKQRHVGRYEDDTTAAKAYDKAAVYLYGNKAITNFTLGACMEDTTEISPFIVLAKAEAQQGVFSGRYHARPQQYVQQPMLSMQKRFAPGAAQHGRVITGSIPSQCWYSPTQCTTLQQQQQQGLQVPVIAGGASGGGVPPLASHALQQPNNELLHGSSGFPAAPLRPAGLQGQQQQQQHQLSSEAWALPAGSICSLPDPHQQHQQQAMLLQQVAPAVSTRGAVGQLQSMVPAGHFGQQNAAAGGVQQAYDLAQHSTPMLTASAAGAAANVGASAAMAGPPGVLQQGYGGQVVAVIPVAHQQQQHIHASAGRSAVLGALQGLVNSQAPMYWPVQHSGPSADCLTCPTGVATCHGF